MGREDEEGGLLSLLGCSDLSTMLGKRSGGKKSAGGYGGDSQVRDSSEGVELKAYRTAVGRRLRRLLGMEEGTRGGPNPGCLVNHARQAKIEAAGGKQAPR